MVYDLTVTLLKERISMYLTLNVAGGSVVVSSVATVLSDFEFSLSRQTISLT